MAKFTVITSKETKYGKHFNKIQTKTVDPLLGESQLTYYFFGNKFAEGSELDVNVDDYKVVEVPFTPEDSDEEIILKYLRKK